jgi:hypothetical protein
VRDASQPATLVIARLGSGRDFSAAILLNNSETLFHRRVYEADDYAANSLHVSKSEAIS